MKVTIIEQPALRLISCKSKCFPEGNKEAFRSIEVHLETLQGRRFYGLVYEAESRMDYYAGLVPKNDTEEATFAGLGYQTIEVRSGACARVTLKDWQSNLDRIGPIIGEVIGKYGYDPSRPQMEFYRSMTELHLIVPLPS